MAKIYFKVCIFLILLGGTIGWLLPALFSAASDFAVLLGIVGIVVGGYLFYKFGKNIYKDCKVACKPKSKCCKDGSDGSHKCSCNH